MRQDGKGKVRRGWDRRCVMRNIVMRGCVLSVRGSVRVCMCMYVCECVIPASFCIVSVVNGQENEEEEVVVATSVLSGTTGGII